MVIVVPEYIAEIEIELNDVQAGPRTTTFPHPWIVAEHGWPTADNLGRFVRKRVLKPPIGLQIRIVEARLRNNNALANVVTLWRPEAS